jgi:hypothetical protein
MSTLKKKTAYASQDSPEAQRACYNRKIMLLEIQLNSLTLLEDPLEIRAICCKIIVLKNMLRATTGNGVANKHAVTGQ